MCGGNVISEQNDHESDNDVVGSFGWLNDDRGSLFWI